MLALLGHMGVRVTLDDKNHVTLSGESIPHKEAPYEMVKTMRAAILVLGPTLARFGEARVSLPGGCAIGARPIDQHLKGCRRWAPTINVEHGYVHRRRCPASRAHDRVRSADRDRHREPDDGRCAGRGPHHSRQLRARAGSGGARRVPQQDGRAGSKAPAPTSSTSAASTDCSSPSITPSSATASRPARSCAAAGAGGRGRAPRERPAEALEPVIVKMRKAGLEIERERRARRVRRQGNLKAVDVTTAPHPGFPTDMQAQFMAMMCVAEGARVLTETIFENRFMHVPELCRMGADIEDPGQHRVRPGREAARRARA